MTNASPSTARDDATANHVAKTAAPQKAASQAAKKAVVKSAGKPAVKPSAKKANAQTAATKKAATQKPAAPKTAKPARPAVKPAAKPAAKPSAKKPVAQPSAEAAKTAAPAATKPKLVRDSFTIPKGEYAQLDALKLRAAKLARPTKKSEVLRAGIAALAGMSDEALLKALNVVPSLKTGRPSKGKHHGK